MARLYDVLAEIVKRLAAGKLGTAVVLDSYTTTLYTCPSDGYLCATMGLAANARASASLHDEDGNYIGEIGAMSSDYGSWLIFVRKGMKVKTTGASNNGHVTFYPMRLD